MVGSEATSGAALSGSLAPAGRFRAFSALRSAALRAFSAFAFSDFCLRFM